MKVVALIVQTVRELVAKATLFVLAGISTLIILVVLLSIGSTETPEGVVLTMFSLPVSPPSPADKLAEVVSIMQAGFAGGLFVGVVIFGVFATAGIVPDTLEKGTIDLYLSKPVARWELLLGRYLGAVVVMLINILYFLGAIWVIIGFKVGVWNVHFLFAALSLTFVFACLFSLTLALGVLFRNTAIPIIGSFLHLFVIGGILEHRDQSLFLISENAVYRRIIDGFYYLLPQISAMQENVANLIMQQTITWEPFVQSFLVAALYFGAAVVLFMKMDF